MILKLQEIGLFVSLIFFDGISILHKFVIQKGKISYQSKLTGQQLLDQIKRTGGCDIIAGEDPTKSIFFKLSSFFHDIIVTNAPVPPAVNTVSVCRLNESLVIKTDTSQIEEIDWDTLETKNYRNYVNVNRQLEGQLAPSHSQYDHKKREYFNFTINLRNKTYTAFKISNSDSSGNSSNNNVTVLATFRYDPVYCHSFALTENYMIMILISEPIHLFKFLFTRSYVKSLQFDTSRPTLFYVISRNPEKGIVGIFKAPKPFFTFHNINAYESGNSIIIDNCTYTDDRIMVDNYVSNLLKMQSRNYTVGVRRFTIDMSNPSTTEIKEVKEEVLFSDGIELPRFNQHYHMKEYKYGFGISFNFDKVKKT